MNFVLVKRYGDNIIRCIYLTEAITWVVKYRASPDNMLFGIASQEC